MRKLAILAIPCLFLVFGCSEGENAVKKAASKVEQQANGVVHDAKKAAEKAAKKTVEGVEDAMTADVVTLVGTAGCGHCTFEKGTSCSVAMKGADGVVYILEGVEEDQELFEKRKEGNEIKVVGVVETRDGENYIKVKSYEM